MLICLWVERMEPLAGTAATEGSEPLRFDGWLELLGVVSELVAAGALERRGRGHGGQAPRGSILIWIWRHRRAIAANTVVTAD